MTCATNITAHRNADYSVTYRFPPAITFVSARMQIRASQGAPGAALLNITLAPTSAGSAFAFTGSSILLVIKRADLEALPVSSPVSDPWIGEYDIILTNAAGIESYFLGGSFTVLEGVTR